jgi:hypothetical protein
VARADSKGRQQWFVKPKVSRRKQASSKGVLNQGGSETPAEVSDR